MAGGAGAVPAERSTPGTAAEYVDTPVIATVRRVHTRADGTCDTNDAMVQANHRAAASVDTTTNVAPADIPPPRYNAQAPIGNSPLTIDGVDRASTWIEISFRWRSLRTRSRRARWASTGCVAPASFTVRAADSADTSAVANAARAPTVWRPDRSSSGPKTVATAPETSMAVAKNSGRNRSPRHDRHGDQDEHRNGMVDEVVGKDHNAFGVASLCDDLGGRVGADAAGAGLAVDEAIADPQHLAHPPLGEPGECSTASG